MTGRPAAFCYGPGHVIMHGNRAFIEAPMVKGCHPGYDLFYFRDLSRPLPLTFNCLM